MNQRSQISLLVFQVETPCGLVGREDINVSKEHTAAIFRADIYNFLKCLGPIDI
jgi:hypothetical protein